MIAENLPGMKEVRNEIVWVSGIVEPAPAS